ncbi:hypothetical protein IQ22_00695 [Pseudomonas duriflava]|uniref:PH (Pleckstrin Homology) domain-containing protein n=1 Tax=Pseudomonas duriflava TaxID=459528 RepID=A0A562QL21_9PSED|nr:hypothetical protein [Pseudomonas duriflava]TWI57478.1 hypothetical protein IQ22_00695 [Pseudomonas duriflava]
MVEVEFEGDDVIFIVKGIHKLWALKSQLTIPQAHILAVRRDDTVLHAWKGWKAPGTKIPNILTAGTFYLEGEQVFWDVSHAEGALVIDLEDEQYKRLIIEVEHPEAVIEALASAIERNRAQRG